MRRLVLFLTISLILVSSVIGIILTSPIAKANSFDPGNIISDSVFTNSTSMSADSIQQFIVAKGVSCTNGQAPCLKNYTENGKSAGTIIMEIARTYSINPQVLITTLQKEVGLVTLTTPESWRYRTAMGYGCPDSTPGVCNDQYFGFTNQLTWAAKMFRAIMNNTPTWYTPYILGNNYIQYHPNASCGGTNVNIKNRATQALYNYTPYQPNQAALSAGYGQGDGCSAYGNRNFWLYFNDWFGSSTSSILIQSPQSAAVYLQSGNTRYAIPSWDVIDAYGFGRFGVTAVSDSYMNSLNNGGVLSTVFSNKSQPGPIYLADNGYRFGFSSHQQCIDWGFPSCTSVSFAKALEPSVFDRMNVYGDISPLMLNGTHIYLMQAGKKLPFMSEKARQEHGYGATKYTPITNPQNTSQAVSKSLPQNNSILSISNHSTVYTYNNGEFYSLTYTTLQNLQSSGVPVFHDAVSAYVSNPPKSSATVGTIQTGENGMTFLLTETQKIDISLVKNNWPDAQYIPNLKELLNKRATSAKASLDTTFRTPQGTIFMVVDKRWRGFQTLSDYFALGHTTPLSVDKSVLASITPGEPIMAPGNGTLFQTKENPSGIYTLALDGSVCQIYSMPQVGLYRLSDASAPRLNALPSSTINLLSTTTYDEAGNLHIRYGSIHSTIPAASLSSVWGVAKRMPLCSFSNVFFERQPSIVAQPKFVRNEHTGIIYFGENGKKRPIYSYSEFLKMGGNSQNTQDVSMEFLVASPDGVPIY